MKIIERPVPEPGWWDGIRTECLKCHILIELEASDDLKQEYGYGGWGALYECPKCKDRNFVFMKR